MTAEALTTLLKDYGPWGLLAISLLTIRWLFLKYDSARQEQIADGKLHAGALKDAAEGLNKTNEILEKQAADIGFLKIVFERRLKSE